VDRVKGRAGAEQTPIGLVPGDGDIDLAGLDVAPSRVREAMSINPGDWLKELDGVKEYFTKLGVDSTSGFDAQIEKTRAALQKGR
jgi:phosphoenolpyruvate carboxykinase (GTP)